MKETLLTRTPLKIYRHLRWMRGLNQEYRHNYMHFSKEYAQLSRKAAIMEHQKKPIGDVLKAYELKDNYIIQYLEALCSDVIVKYQSNSQILPKHNCGNIWVLWWTGEDSAPDIIKACIKSIRRNANGHNVIVLDQNNYTTYISFPEYIVNKHAAGLISHAAFSDILRVSLLSHYGGTWIDSTVFLSQPLPKELSSTSFYTLKAFNNNATYYSKSRWCGYFLAGSSDFLLFSFVRDFLLAYWERSDYLIDYLIMDYAFGIACKYFPDVKETIDQLPDNNTLRGKLMNAINEPYSEALFTQLSSQDTFASKLSWRYGKPRATNTNGELTNYGYLLTL